MTVDEALNFFSSGYELAHLLNIRTQNVYQWKRSGWIPLKQQHKINEALGLNLPIDIDKKALKIRLMNRFTLD